MPGTKLFRRAAPKPRGPSCIDLFSGAGGLAVGFRSAGWAILAANDLDSAASETFRLNFPEASFFEGPIGQLSAAELLKECNLKAGQLDCLIGGPPCQSFSYNNHQRSAEDARARLFENYIRLVEGLKPKTLLMENVPGILTIGNGSVIKEIVSRLKVLGYHAAVEIISAEEFGTPQIRKRVFIAASRIGAATELIPLPTHWGVGLKARRNGKVISRPTCAKQRLVTVWQAMSDLPKLKNGGGSEVLNYPKNRPSTLFQREIRKGSASLYNHICHSLSDVNMKRLKCVPEGGNWRDIPRRLLPAGMKRARKSDHTKRYGRLSKVGLSSTILTKCDPHWGAYVHPTQDRIITVREAARLQGFPDSFRFAGLSLTNQYVQVGNAVPIPVAKAIAKAVLSEIRAWKRRSKKLSQIKCEKLQVTVRRAA